MRRVLISFVTILEYLYYKVVAVQEDFDSATQSFFDKLEKLADDSSMSHDAEVRETR